jgi:hypothetical protein
MPPAKDLFDHVHDETFIPRRHRELLENDDSLLERKFSDDEVSAYWMTLAELQLYYRHIARNEAERREAALAFRDAIARDYARSDALLGDNRIAQNKKGGWKLVPITKSDRIRHQRRFLLELWEGLLKQAESDMPEKRLAQAHFDLTVRLARKHGIDEQSALKHVAAELRRMADEDAA